MLSDDEREALRELERQFSVGPVVVGQPHGYRERSRFANIFALVTSTISTVTLLAAGSVGVALQPGTAAGPDMQALTRLHQLFVQARSRRLIPDRIAPAPKDGTTMRQPHCGEGSRPAGSGGSTCTVTHSIELLGPGAVRGPHFNQGVEATPAGRLRDRLVP